jgi:hypothetical protein
MIRRSGIIAAVEQRKSCAGAAVSIEILIHVCYDSSVVATAVGQRRGRGTNGKDSRENQLPHGSISPSRRRTRSIRRTQLSLEVTPIFASPFYGEKAPQWSGPGLDVGDGDGRGHWQRRISHGRPEPACRDSTWCGTVRFRLRQCAPRRRARTRRQRPSTYCGAQACPLSKSRPVDLCSLYVPIGRMLRDRGDQLKYAIANALSGAARIVRGLRTTLTVGQREDVAEAAVNELRALPNDPWKLSEPLPKSWGVMSDLGASTPEGWCRTKPSKPDGE